MGIESDLKAHLQSDWKTAHGIWSNVRPLVPTSEKNRIEVYRNADQTNVVADDWKIIEYDTEVYDAAGLFSTATWEFTTPSTGLYLIVSHMTIRNSTAAAREYRAAYFVDGVFGGYLGRHDQFVAGGYYFDVNGSALVWLTAGQKITIRAYFSTVNNNKITGGAGITYLSICQIMGA